MKNICIVTGTRAEYGLLRGVMEGIEQSAKLKLQLIVTGMHLSPEFGSTINAIEAEDFKIDRKVEMLLSSDTAVGVTKSMGLGLIGFADALEEISPDLILVLGDRFEIFAAVIAALIAKIPVAHIHGGEVTEGAYDDQIRHSITKISQLHFTASEEYRQRVIQLGENPRNVFNVGGLGVDNIFKLNLMSREKLEEALEFKLGKRNLIITYHPVTLDENSSRYQIEELLSALDALEDVNFIFTSPNADNGGRIILQRIQDFCFSRSNAKFFKSLGQMRYLSCLSHFDGVIGNSSSGLLEAPSFKIGTLNIGNRQKGRLKASSVIDCDLHRESILEGIIKILSTSFRASLSNAINPYGDGGASKKIIKILESQDFDKSVSKSFFDLRK